jgi:hypothetical protein
MVNVHQINDAMLRGHPKHDTNSKPSDYFRFLRTETHLQRELCLKPPMPRTTILKDGWGRESNEESCELKPQSLNLPRFNAFFDTLSFENGTPWGSVRQEPID